MSGRIIPTGGSPSKSAPTAATPSTPFGSAPTGAIASTTRISAIRSEPGTLRIAEILVVDAIAPVGAEPNGVDGVAAVGADFDGEPPVGMIRPLIDQPVSRLIGPELVIIDFLVVVDLEQRVAARGGFRVATVKETGAVMRPRGARELDPFQVIAQVLPGCHVAHAEFLPIGAAA